MRGLSSNHALTLINGRRIADTPSAYEGAVNFTNTVDIPSAFLDRTEIRNGSASAIYGSDAIAGVVNIVLKEHAKGVTLNLKAGGTQLGGDANARAQLSGGFEAVAPSGGKGLEFSKRDSIWSLQLDFMADSTLKGANAPVVFGPKDSKASQYIAPESGLATRPGSSSMTR